MAGPHENLEHAEHAQHAAHEGGRDNKKIALVISVLALFLAFSETFGKASQTEALNLQIEASNLWNFMQAKTIRRTFTLVQSEAAKIEAATTPDEARKAALAKQIGEWEKTAARYRSEPEAGNGKGEGTVELMRRALEKEKQRDLQFNKYHNFEFASAAFQIGIVLCFGRRDHRHRRARMGGNRHRADRGSVHHDGIRAADLPARCRAFLRGHVLEGRHTRAALVRGAFRGGGHHFSAASRATPPAASARGGGSARCGGRSAPSGQASSARTVCACGA